MADKAKMIWRKLNLRRDQILREFNNSTLNDVGAVGAEKGMAALKDMNDFEVGHDECVKSLASRVQQLGVIGTPSRYSPEKDITQIHGAVGEQREDYDMVWHMEPEFASGRIR